MEEIANFLKGKKTIIIGVLMISLGLLKSDTQIILEGFGLVFLRMGIK